MRACPSCMRSSTAKRRPNAPSIAPTRPHFALQSSADHLVCALRPCLPACSFRHLLCLWHRQHRRARRMRLGTTRRRSNAPGIAPTRPRVAEKRPSDSRPFVRPSMTLPTPSSIPHLTLLMSPLHRRARREAAGGGAGVVGVRRPGSEAAARPLGRADGGARCMVLVLEKKWVLSCHVPCPA